MAHIIMICTANICRSPLAEKLLARHLSEKAATDSAFADWVVSSAGTWANRARGAATGSIAMAEERDLDLSEHVARMVTEEIAEEGDLLLCMTANHKEALQLDFRDQADKIYLLTEMVGRKYDISDPYGGPYEGYVTMAQEVEKLIAEGLPKIIEVAAKNADSRKQIE